jgi:hypothetical protein
MPPAEGVWAGLSRLSLRPRLGRCAHEERTLSSSPYTCLKVIVARIKGLYLLSSFLSRSWLFISASTRGSSLM